MPALDQPAPEAAAHPTAPPSIKTECGRAKYAELSQRRSPLARLRLAWFVAIASLRDWRLP